MPQLRGRALQDRPGKNQNVLPHCSHHHRMGARERLNVFLDGEGRYELGQEVLPVDALSSKTAAKYPERLKKPWKAPAKPMPSSSWAVPSWVGTWWWPASSSTSWAAAWAAWSASVLCAAWKPPSNRKCLHLFHRHRRCPHAGRLAEPDADGQNQRSPHPHGQKGLPYISVLTDPTMGGVSAGFAFPG